MQQHRTMVGAVMGSLVVIGLTIWVALPPEDVFAAPAPALLVGQLAAGVAVHLLLNTVGYRTAPLDPELDAETVARQAGERLMSGTVVRLAISESVAIVSLALTFVLTPSTILSYAGGAVVSLVLLWVHAWPSARLVDRVATDLERDGARTGLRERVAS